MDKNIDNYLTTIYRSLEGKYQEESNRSRNLDNSLTHQLTVLAGYITIMLYFLKTISDKNFITNALSKSVKWIFILYALYTLICAFTITFQIKAFVKAKKLSARTDHDQNITKYLSSAKYIKDYIKDYIDMLSFVIYCNFRYNEAKKKWVNNSWKMITTTSYLLFVFLTLYLIMSMV